MSMQAAVAAWRRGDYRLAAKSCQQHLRNRPGDADALHLLGLCLVKMERTADALTYLKAAARARPGDAQIIRNLGGALWHAGSAAEAAEVWSSLPAPDLALRYQIAEAWLAAEVPARAIVQLKALLEAAPDEPRGWSMLARIYDEQNELDKAESHAGRALELDRADFQANLVLARLAQRRGRLQSAYHHLETVLATSLTPTNRALALGVKARLLDRKDDTQGAFAAVAEANQLLADTPAFRSVRGTSVYSLAAIAELTAFLTDERCEQWAGQPVEGQGTAEQPVFLVGFPRSGTTLLDRILNAHPQIRVIEEQPLAHDILQFFAGKSGQLQRADSLAGPQGADLRRAYWRRVDAQLGQRHQGLVIDKLPLNLIYIALLWRVFPSASFLFALRDPRDVVLSCWFQTFGANDAMSHFLSLDEAADYYVQAMSLARSSVARLPAKYLDMRYEDLVGDLEGSARRAVDFLQLGWDDAVLDFASRLQGERINTPSFDQVSQPVYGSAAGRWQRYAQQLQPILPRLESLVQQLGYTD